MIKGSCILTLDSNVLIAALKEDEPYSEKCSEILGGLPDIFTLSEPSIVYQEVCGTLARKVGVNIAAEAKRHLDKMIHPRFLIDCNKAFCASAYPFCHEYSIYSIDAIYLKVALDTHAVLVSLDKEDFIDKVNSKNPTIEAYHISEFPY